MGNGLLFLVRPNEPERNVVLIKPFDRFTASAFLQPLENNSSSQGSQVKFADSRDEKAIKPSLREIVLLLQEIVPVRGWG